MKIVIAPDSFKGSLRAQDVCDAMRKGALRAAPKAEIVCVPMADGGEGTVQSLTDALGGQIVSWRPDSKISQTNARVTSRKKSVAFQAPARRAVSVRVSLHF
jgi:glycerate kinase